MTALKFLSKRFLLLVTVFSVILSLNITAQSSKTPVVSCVHEVPCEKLDLMISDLQKASFEHKQYQNLQISHGIVSTERNFLKDANQLLEKDRDKWKVKAQTRNYRFWGLVIIDTAIIAVSIALK